MKHDGIQINIGKHCGRANQTSTSPGASLHWICPQRLVGGREEGMNQQMGLLRKVKVMSNAGFQAWIHLQFQPLAMTICIWMLFLIQCSLGIFSLNFTMSSQTMNCSQKPVHSVLVGLMRFPNIKSKPHQEEKRNNIDFEERTIQQKCWENNCNKLF